LGYKLGSIDSLASEDIALEIKPQKKLIFDVTEENGAKL
jgi:hypothetical protein